MRTQATGARSLFSLFSSKESVLLLFFLEEKNGQLAREAQALRRTDAGTSCVVVGRNTTAGMPPSSALSLPVSAAPARQLSRANRPRKRKSIAEQLSFCAPAVFPNALHKTGGSYVNRLLFFLEEKKQKKIICGAVALRCCCLFHQRATQNGRFIWKPSVFLYNWVGCAGNILFSERKPPPQCLLFLFFKKRNRSPSFLFKKKRNRSPSFLFRRKEIVPL